MIGTRSMILEEANGIAIWPWITLELGFQNWNFCQKIEFCQWSFCAVFRFFLLGLHSELMYDWIRSRKTIQILSLKPQQANGIRILPWIVLELGFQNWNFCQKIEFCQWSFCSVFRLMALGFASLYMYEWIRSKTWSKSFAFMVWKIWFFKIFFQYFPCYFVPIMTNSLQFFPYLIMHEFLNLLHVQKDLIN